MIDVRGLIKRYGSNAVVNNISFSVAEGEIFGLLGPNGAGKTTVISILATLLHPDGGAVSISGYDVTRQANRVKPMIGFVPQDLALYPTLSAFDNLSFFARIYGFKGKALSDKVESSLDMVDLRNRADDAVQTFSGGMKRRLNIAAGLIHDPRVLFLDEPTVAVDPQSRNFIFEHVEKLKRGCMTILYTTHYMEEAERLCDRVAIMDHGEILALDTPKKLIGLLASGLIRVKLPPDKVPVVAAGVRDLPRVREASSQDDVVKVVTDDPLATLPALIRLCDARSAAMLSLEMLEPNLETVFLHLTGKRLRE